MQLFDSLDRKIQSYALAAFKRLDKCEIERKLDSLTYQELDQITDADKYFRKVISLISKHVIHENIDADLFIKDASYQGRIADLIVCAFMSEEEMCGTFVQIAGFMHNEIVIEDSTIYKENKDSARPNSREEFENLTDEEFYKELAIVAIIINHLGYSMGEFDENEYEKFEPSLEMKKAYYLCVKGIEYSEQKEEIIPRENENIELNSMTATNEETAKEVLKTDKDYFRELLTALSSHGMNSEENVELAYGIFVLKPDKIPFIIELIEGGKTEKAIRLVMETILEF